MRAETPQSGDEIAFLVDSFNGMLEQIEQRDRALEEARSVLERRVEERTVALSAANKELEAFSYSVAHDLPRSLAADHEHRLPPHTRLAETGERDEMILVDKIFEGSKRMSTLIDDLLSLSRATSTPLNRKSVSLDKDGREDCECTQNNRA